MASTLSKYSTAQDVLNAIRDNATFIENNSVSEAKAFVTAYHHWLTHNAKLGKTGGLSGESFELQIEQWAQVYETAKGFIDASASQEQGGVGVVHPDFGDFRR